MSKRSTGIEWLTPHEFQRLAEKSATPASVRGKGIRKQVLPEIDLKAANDEALTIPFLISSSARDRQRDTIDPRGWRLENYRRNPVVLWAHDYSALPVARALSIEPRSTGLASLPQFTSRELYPFGHTVYQMIRAGFLNACSVGFQPDEWVWNEVEKGIDYSAQELLEFSIVPIPANPEALVEARSAGIDLDPMRQWAEKTLDAWHEEQGLWLPKSHVEAVIKILGEHKIVSAPAPKSFTPHAFPLASSYEWISRKLQQTCKPYMQRMLGARVREDEDSCRVAATFADRAVIGVIGMDRPFEDDLCFEVPWTAGADGPTWSGEPREIEIEVRAEIRPAMEQARAYVEAEIKRGRVVSSANEQRLQKAADKNQECHDEIMAVLAQVREAPEQEGLAITEQRSADPVLDIHEPAKEGRQEITLPDVPSNHIPLEPAQARLAIESVAREVLGVALADRVAATINRLRGRVD